jgi:hypothetical protein
MKKRTIYPLIVVSLLLAACAPQVTVTSEVTLTSPPPTDLPTLPPTPIAVDGIAEDAEGNKLAYVDGEWTVLPDLGGNYKLVADADGVRALDANGAVKYALDMATGDWVKLESEAVLLAQADFEKYGFPTEGLEWLEDENGVRAIDPETSKVVYENGKFDVFFVREALAEADVLMPTKYKQMTPGSRVLPGTPTNQMRGEYFVGVLRDSVTTQFVETFGSDLTFDENGRRRNAVVFLLDPETNSWGAVMDVKFPESDSVDQVLVLQRNDGQVEWIRTIRVSHDDVVHFWGNN